MWLLVLQLKESEWQATDWISMYLELVITTTDRSITEVSFTYIYQLMTYHHEWHYW